MECMRRFNRIFSMRAGATARKTKRICDNVTCFAHLHWYGEAFIEQFGDILTKSDANDKMCRRKFEANLTKEMLPNTFQCLGLVITYFWKRSRGTNFVSGRYSDLKTSGNMLACWKCDGAFANGATDHKKCAFEINLHHIP